MESQSKPQEAQRPSFVLEKLYEPREQTGWRPALKADSTVSKDKLYISRLEFPALEKKG